MLAAIGAVGFFLIQYQANREEVHARATAAVKSVLKVAKRQPRPSVASEKNSSSLSGSWNFLHHGRGQGAAKDGAIVCLKDRTGQVAVIQPYGNGGSWQLTFTCASGSSSQLPGGQLAHINSDAVFLVRQVGNNLALSSPGAEGRYLSAVRDLSIPPMLDCTKPIAAAQWRVTGQGITNVQHPHKKLACSICEVKLVPLEAIADAECSMSCFHKEQQNKVLTAEAANKALQAQLQHAAKQLAATSAEYDVQVAQLTCQLSEACSFNSQLTNLVDQKDAKLHKLQEVLSKLKARHQETEHELSTAYSEVAALQQQLAERDEDVHRLQHRMGSETKQWGQLRSVLQDSLQAKDEEIAALTLQVQRMEHALRAVEHTLYGMRKPRRLDRASLDAVSVHQLQAAVDNFAAVGGGAIALAADDMSAQEAAALRVLLEEQTLGSMGLGALAAEPSAEPSLQDLDRHDQGSPNQMQYVAATAAVGTVHVKSPVRAPTSPGARGRLSRWGLSDDANPQNSKAARDSAASDGRYRYCCAGEASDCDSQDGDAHGHPHTDEEAIGNEADADAAVCTSMDEEEMQQQLSRLKASVSQLTSSSSFSKQHHEHQQQAGVKPIRQNSNNTCRPTASMPQLSPVKEEHAAVSKLS